MLLVVPSDMLAFWEGEFAFWAGKDVNVVTYEGSTHSRSTISENELWLQPSSMDGKSATYHSREALPERVCTCPLVSAGLAEGRTKIRNL